MSQTLLIVYVVGLFPTPAVGRVARHTDRRGGAPPVVCARTLL